MRKFHQQSAGIGNRRKPRFRNHSRILLPQHPAVGLDLFARGVLVELVQLQFSDATLQPCCREKPTRRAKFLNEEESQTRNSLKHRSRENFPGVMVAQGRWDQI